MTEMNISLSDTNKNVKTKSQMSNETKNIATSILLSHNVTTLLLSNQITETKMQNIKSIMQNETISIVRSKVFTHPVERLSDVSSGYVN